MEPIEDLGFRFRGDFTSFPAALEKTADAAQTRVDELLLDVIQERLETRLRRHLGDARPHGAGANDADFFYLVTHSVRCFGFKVQCSEFNVEPGTWNSELVSIFR